MSNDIPGSSHRWITNEPQIGCSTRPARRAPPCRAYADLTFRANRWPQTVLTATAVPVGVNARICVALPPLAIAYDTGINVDNSIRNKQTVCMYELTGMIAELASRSSLSTNVRSTKMAAPNGTTTWPRNRGSSSIKRIGAAMISCCRASGCVSLTRCSNSE